MKQTKESTQIQDSAEVRARKLEEYFSEYDGAIVAYSGGVDSALLAFSANRVLKDRMVAVIADSSSLARREYRGAVDFARNHGIPLQIVQTREMADPDYRANQGNRCYFCKKALFEKLREIQQQLSPSPGHGSWPVFYGVNKDDLGDHRPGIEAAREASILAPYVEMDMDKNAIRAVCRHYGLEVADKPAMPCMSSRISYGEAVTEEKLSQVERAEDFLYGLGLRILRVRHHGDIARIEIPPADFTTILENRDKISSAFHDMGFLFVSLDLDGFKSGSLNTSLTRISE